MNLLHCRTYVTGNRTVRRKGKLFTVAKYHAVYTRIVLPCMVTVDRFRYGRRTMSLISASGMATTMIGLGIYLEVGDGSSDLSWLPLLLMLMYIVSTKHSPRDRYHNILLYTNITHEFPWFVPKVSVPIFYLDVYWTHLKLQVISFKL